jgi:hypothetical protein
MPVCSSNPRGPKYLNVRDFGAKGDGVTDDTVAINACMDAATLSTTTRLVYAPAGTYAVSNLLFGTQSGSGQSGHPAGLVGDGRATTFKAKTGATGTVLQAWGVSFIQFRDFVVDCDGNAACGIDTSWKGGAGPSLQNVFDHVWVENFTGAGGKAGWEARDTNDSSFDHCKVHRPHASNTSLIGFNINATGGPVWFQDTIWDRCLLDLSCQNGVFTGCWGYGIRLSETTAGQNAVVFNGHQFFPSALGNQLMVWSDTADTAAVCAGLTAVGSFINPQVAGDIFYEGRFYGAINLIGCIAESEVNWRLISSNTVNAAAGPYGSVNIIGLSCAGAGTPNLAVVTNFNPTSRRMLGVLDHIGNETLNVMGQFELEEESGDLNAAKANRVRVYARDNGAGKTQLVARFATGAVQVIATEP